MLVYQFDLVIFFITIWHYRHERGLAVEQWQEMYMPIVLHDVL
jgi:hypothetical protein